MYNNSKFIVYLVTSPSGKRYVGITKQFLKDRMQDHYNVAFNYKRSSKFQNAIKKYNKELRWEIIDTAESWKQLCELEKYYIQLYDSYKNGYNSTLGGEGNIGWKPSDAVKEKMSLAKKGKIPYKAIEGTISKFKKHFIVKDKITEEIIGNWDLTSKCAKDLNLDISAIRKCLKKLKHFNSHKGLTFTYSIED